MWLASVSLTDIAEMTKRPREWDLPSPIECSPKSRPFWAEPRILSDDPGDVMAAMAYSYEAHASHAPASSAVTLPPIREVRIISARGDALTTDGTGHPADPLDAPQGRKQPGVAALVALVVVQRGLDLYRPTVVSSVTSAEAAWDPASSL